MILDFVNTQCLEMLNLPPYINPESISPLRRIVYHLENYRRSGRKYGSFLKN